MSESPSAIVEYLGRQFRVAAGSVLTVQASVGEPGKEVTLERVLSLTSGETTLVGTPYVKGATVKAVVASNFRATKVVVFKKKNKGYTKTQGHRQPSTRLIVREIVQ